MNIQQMARSKKEDEKRERYLIWCHFSWGFPEPQNRKGTPSGLPIPLKLPAKSDDDGINDDCIDNDSVDNDGADDEDH